MKNMTTRRAAAKLIAKRKAAGLLYSSRLYGDRMALKGKNALVTGGGRGIGAAIAETLAKEGVNVAVAARTKKEIEGVAQSCRKLGVKSVPIVCDVSKTDDIRKMVAAAAKALGSIDILVNNAGTAWYEKLSEMDESKIRATIDVNLYGVIMTTREALKHMKKGVIVNISSGAGKTGIPCFAAYCATKFGVIGFTESLAEELDGIKVYAVCPGPIDTKLYHDLFHEHPRKKPQDVADVVLETIKNPTVRSGGSVNVY